MYVCISREQETDRETGRLDLFAATVLGFVAATDRRLDVEHRRSRTLNKFRYVYVYEGENKRETGRLDLFAATALGFVAATDRRLDVKHSRSRTLNNYTHVCVYE